MSIDHAWAKLKDAYGDPQKCTYRWTPEQRRKILDRKTEHMDDLDTPTGGDNIDAQDLAGSKTSSINLDLSTPATAPPVTRPVPNNARTTPDKSNCLKSVLRLRSKSLLPRSHHLNKTYRLYKIYSMYNKEDSTVRAQHYVIGKPSIRFISQILPHFYRLINEDSMTPLAELKTSLQGKIRGIQILLEDTTMLRATAQTGRSSYIQRISNLTKEACAKLQVLAGHKEDIDYSTTSRPP